MILLGDKNIPFEETSYITTHEEINNTKPNSTVLFDYDIKLMKYCEENSIEYGVIVSSIKESIYANSLDAKYIICEKNISSQLQKLATNYMFDSKVLAKIENDTQIEEVALENIDGAIYKDILK